MKKVLILAEVPEECDFESVHFFSVDIREAFGGDVYADYIEYKIIIPPTEEEISAHFKAYAFKAKDVIDWYKKQLGL